MSVIVDASLVASDSQWISTRWTLDTVLGWHWQCMHAVMWSLHVELVDLLFTVQRISVSPCSGHCCYPVHSKSRNVLACENH